jgi:hypothetical protein
MSLPFLLSETTSRDVVSVATTVGPSLINSNLAYFTRSVNCEYQEDSRILPEVNIRCQDITGESKKRGIWKLSGKHHFLGCELHLWAGERDPGAPPLPRPPHLVDDLFRQDLKGFVLGKFLFPDTGDQPFPSSTNADYPKPLADRPDRDGPDGRVQARHITASRQDADRSFDPLDACHAVPLSD